MRVWSTLLGHHGLAAYTLRFHIVAGLLTIEKTHVRRHAASQRTSLNHDPRSRSIHSCHPHHHHRCFRFSLPIPFQFPCPSFHSNQMCRKQEIAHTLFDRIFEAAVPAHQLAFHHSRLQQQAVELLQDFLAGFVRLLRRLLLLTNHIHLGIRILTILSHLTVTINNINRIPFRNQRLQSQLCRRGRQRIPVHARQDVAQEQRVEVDLGALERRILEVQWERCW